MQSRLNAALIGTGSIGAGFSKRAKDTGYDVVAEVNSRGVSGAFPTEFITRGDTEEISAYLRNLLKYQGVDIAAFALPSSNDGLAEKSYMLPFLERGIPCVTAGKPALSQHYDYFRRYLPIIGRRATVGGGSGILHSAKQWLTPGVPCTIRAIVNGTMANASWRFGNDWSPDAVLKEALDLQYAEKPENGESPSLLKMYQGELEDVLRKVLISINELFYSIIGRGCRPDDISFIPLTDEDYIRKFIAANSRLDYVVEIRTDGTVPEVDVSAPGSLWADFGSVHVRGGFCHLYKTEILGVVLPEGPGNALVVSQGGRVATFAGPGAGPGPTVEQMMLDVQELTANRHGREETHQEAPEAALAPVRVKTVRSNWADPEPKKETLGIKETFIGQGALSEPYKSSKNPDAASAPEKVWAREEPDYARNYPPFGGPEEGYPHQYGNGDHARIVTVED